MQKLGPAAVFIVATLLQLVSGISITKTAGVSTRRKDPSGFWQNIVGWTAVSAFAVYLSVFVS